MIGALILTAIAAKWIALVVIYRKVFGTKAVQS